MVGLLGACSSTGLKKVFHDNFADYTPESSVPTLQLPKGVQLAAEDSYYQIPPAPSTTQEVVNLYPPGSNLQKQAEVKSESE